MYIVYVGYLDTLVEQILKFNDFDEMAKTLKAQENVFSWRIEIL